MNKKTKEAIKKYLQENPENKIKLEELMTATSPQNTSTDSRVVFSVIIDTAVKIAILFGGTNAGLQILDRINPNAIIVEDAPRISMSEEEFVKTKSLLESEKYKEFCDLNKSDFSIPEILDSFLHYEKGGKVEDLDISKLLEEFEGELFSLDDFSLETLETSDPKYLDQCAPDRGIDNTLQFAELFFVIGNFLQNESGSDFNNKYSEKPINPRK